MASVAVGSIVAVAAGVLALEDHAARKAVLDRIAALEDAVPVELVSVERSTEAIARDAARCAGDCREFLARWPSSAEAWKVRGTLLRMLCHLEGRHGEEAIDLARILVRRPDLGPVERHKALEVLLVKAPAEFGDRPLERIETILEEIGAEYDRRIAELPAGPKLKQLDYRRGSAEGLLSRVLLGLAKYPEAQRVRQATMARLGGSPTPDPIDRFLADRIGREPEVDLADARWVTDRSLDLRGARGSVVAIMIHGIVRPVPDGDRLQAFGRAIDARRAEGLAGIIVCFYDEKAGARGAERVALELRQDLDRFGIALPAAVLPSARIGGLFPRSCSGGTVIIDRRGRLVWYATLFGTEGLDWSLTRLVLDQYLCRDRTEAEGSGPRER
jgi:hypothetical protein